MRITSEARVTHVRPGSIHGNAYFASAQTVTVVHRDQWTLYFDGGEGTAVESRRVGGTGASRVEVEPGHAYAIRNDGRFDLQVLEPEGASPRVLVEPLTRVAGVDGARGGWLAVVKDGDTIEVQLCATTGELQALFESCAVVAIDVPIGLVEEGQRACDFHARKFLRNKSSVFTAPIRPILRAGTPSEAQAIARSVQNGHGLPYTTVALREVVAEVDEILQRHHELRGRVYEVHPEVSFAHWNRGDLGSKRSADGLAARRRLVTARYGELPKVPRGAREDDLLDAFAALWTAGRILSGDAQTLGDAHEDRTGLPMRIVY